MRFRCLVLMIAGLAGSMSVPAADEGTVRLPWYAFSVPAPTIASPKSGGLARAPEPGLPELGNPIRRDQGCRSLEIEVCLDSSGRLNVPGAKRFLPRIEGLEPERLTIRRGSVQFVYSF